MRFKNISSLGARAHLHQLLLSIGLIIAIGGALFAAEPNVELSNKELVRAAFEAWRTGSGGPFTLLASNATWTITGQSIAAKTYTNRHEFLDVVINPFNARLAKPLVPTLRVLSSDDDTVIALFDGEATAADGKPYRNTYAWFMTGMVKSYA